MRQKLRTLINRLFDPSISKFSLLRYAVGQTLAYIGVGKYIPFHTPHYALYLTKSPVAMVLFGNPEKIRDEEAVLSDLLRAGDVVVDIGANIGTFSLRAALHVGTEGRVFSCEAHPATVSTLRRNIQLNKANQITVLAHALGDSAGEVSFTTEAYDDVNHVTPTGNITVPVVQLDSVGVLQTIPRIRCIKIDVEGYELPVVRGGEQTLSKTDYVIFEAYEPNCQRFGYSVHNLFEWFSARGFLLLDPLTREPINLQEAGQLSVKNVLAQANHR